jgi:hypothetical protein
MSDTPDPLDPAQRVPDSADPLQIAIPTAPEPEVRRPVAGGAPTVIEAHGRTLTVARGENNPRVYVLRLSGDVRVRFADRWPEVLDDVRYFRDTGGFPPEARSRTF